MLYNHGFLYENKKVPPINRGTFSILTYFDAGDVVTSGDVTLS